MCAASREQNMKKKLLRTAYHEAGHAVASLLVGIHTKRVTVKPSVGSLGHHETWSFFTADERLALESSDRYEFGATKALRKVINRSIIVLAGGYAEKVFTGRYNWIGASADIDSYHDLIVRLFPDDEERKLFDRWIRRRTEVLVDNSWWRVEAIAHALCERTTLKGDEIREVLWKTVETKNQAAINGVVGGK